MTQNVETTKTQKERKKREKEKKKKKWRCKLADPATQDQAAPDPGRHATQVAARDLRSLTATLVSGFFFFFSSLMNTYFVVFFAVVFAVVVVVFFVLILDVNRVLETRFPYRCHVEIVLHQT